ncbi:hypothetical protein D3C80_1600770 [compost metagenome]
MAQLYRFLQQRHRRWQRAGQGLTLATEFRITSRCGLQRAGLVILGVGLFEQRQGLAVEQVGVGIDAHIECMRGQWYQGDEQRRQEGGATHRQASRDEPSWQAASG